MNEIRRGLVEHNHLHWAFEEALDVRFERKGQVLEPVRRRARDQDGQINVARRCRRSARHTAIQIHSERIVRVGLEERRELRLQS